MSSDDAGEKTEAATDRRRTQAREEGNVVKSTDVTAAALMATVAGALYFLAPGVIDFLAKLLRSSFTDPLPVAWDDSAVLNRLWSIAAGLAWVLLPLLGMMAIAGLAGNLAQVGVLLSPQSLQMKWERINPLSGFGRIFSIAAVARLGGSVMKLVLLAGVAALLIWRRLPSLMAAGSLELGAQGSLAGSLLIELTFWLAGSIFLVAIFDYGFQYWKHERDLRMSKQEVREEMKEMEGDPSIRMRRREVHRKLAQGRELQSVKTADVVITNPTEIAVAIKYDPKTMPAPTVVAKGMGELAAQIRKLAAEHGVPIIERKPLARAIYKDVKVGRPIPVDLYAAFAEILSYVYKITGRKPPKLDV